MADAVGRISGRILITGIGERAKKQCKGAGQKSRAFLFLACGLRFDPLAIVEGDYTMFNKGDFIRYLAGGSAEARPDYGFVIPSAPAADAAPEREQMAKTFLKKTLTEHDKVYHPNGYDPDKDKCNFRAAMIKNDIADDILSEKPKEEVKLGFVEFKEDDKGNKKIVDVVEAKEAVAGGVNDGEESED